MPARPRERTHGPWKDVSESISIAKESRRIWRVVPPHPLSRYDDEANALIPRPGALLNAKTKRQVPSAWSIYVALCQDSGAVFG